MSIINGQYVYRDCSTNGSSLNGEMIYNRAVAISPGANIILANKVSLPWNQVYAMMPLPGHHPAVPSYAPPSAPPAYTPSSSSADDDSTPVLLCILSFIFPLLGIILYFCWNDSRPKRAGAVGTAALAGIVLNLIVIFSY